MSVKFTDFELKLINDAVEDMVLDTELLFNESWKLLTHKLKKTMVPIEGQPIVAAAQILAILSALNRHISFIDTITYRELVRQLNSLQVKEMQGQVKVAGVANIVALLMPFTTPKGEA